MKKVLSLFQVIVITIVIIFAFVGISISQMDDPNRDRSYILDGFTPSPKMYTIDAPVTVNDFDNFYLGVDFAEGNIAQNPINPMWSFAPFNTNGTHYTINGFDWLINNPVFPSGVKGDPVVTYDSLGNLYYDNMKNPVTGTWVVKSSNGGVSWLTGVSANIGVDKNWICADQTAGPYSNYIYGIMTSVTSNIANIVRSTNLGVSFTQVYSASPHVNPGAMVCVGPNGSTQGGSVYAVTNSGSAFASVYNFFRSTNGGTTFTLVSSNSFSGYVGTNVGGRNSVSNMRTRPYPMIAADNSYGTYRGRFYIVYASNTPAGSGNKSDIFCRYSTDFGVTFSAPVVVNDDPNTVNNQQWHPAIWCDKETGKIYVQWMDTRDCPTSDSSMIYATYSTDGGQSFVANQQISNAKAKIDCPGGGGGGTPRYQGDYNGITSNPRGSILSWGDFRYNNYASFASYFPDFAMRMNPTTQTINSINGVRDFNMEVPAVKLYTDTVIVSAVISPVPGSGSFAITYPGGNKLTSYPSSLVVRVTANNVTPGTYTMTVMSSGPNGTPVHKRNVTIDANTTTSITTETEAPMKFDLAQNYPNPFNPVTKIGYSIAKQSNVKITVFDLLGKEITSFKRENQSPGNYNIIFNASNLSTGVYYYKIEAGEFTDVKKMILMK